MSSTLEELEAIKRCKYRYMRCLDQKNWAEMRDVHILETYRNGERRELLWFQDSQGRAETVLLPWRQDHTKIKALLAATNKETE